MIWNGHELVSSGHPEDDSPWCKNCGIPADEPEATTYCPNAQPMNCDHEMTVTETDNWGNGYCVCEECGVEVEPEDQRSFYRDEETGRIVW